MVYLLKMVIFHGYVSHNQRVNGTLLGFDGVYKRYPLVNIQKSIENGHRNSEFSH